ncbi:oligopeptide ABC transporter substrate-binding protein [Tuanshanicoccus lijuaniae]|uniref:oligopeptide ABC transporter substrate-binding protein n=1 Tax=Aerococcaceae bacterium zg-1292 TaxID=2774330 RepID=UPI001938C8B2|nr:oligopeptide ABC transporter substrate-binding protein [Aerococcaceae bacterium zg-1292]MBF6978027.1 oligopeptide ABC transporter substrate-binding protein [Aerococcaceae bacterium zg-BR22]MBS4456051.1 oligopeptide ABC transporter substrate-binding protein [Aerococcaceae bacterium zg-A91]MBS4457803.1 oligopeptide ABC transporter substrate-binding protein [Aerococcaceae bacterium zg-BR33]QQA37680.1 oligopeptide ABC transporter substrate-binding protein [Aerococcaceae bacterium zg-1292]
MKKSIKKIFALGASVLALASVVTPAAVSVSAQSVELSSKVKNDEKGIEGGVLRYALVGPAFSGVLNQMLYDAQPDGTIIGFFQENVLGYDENFLLDDSGFGKIKFDQKNKQVTITIPKGHKWSDGEDITIDDVIFPYYVIGHKDYQGIRYGDNLKNVVGMEEYHDGKADKISGLERVDDYTLRVTYKQFPNSMLQAGGGVLTNIEPEHYLKDVPVGKLLDSDKVRKNPVGMGAFRVKKVVPGESVTFEPNEYYWRGKPKLDGVQLDVVSPDTAVAEMQTGRYDIASLPADQYEVFKDAKNMQVLGIVQNAYTYIGFKFGKFEDGENKPDESKVYADKAIRQAMAYAIDNDAIGERFYHGLRWRANSPITPNFKEYHDDSIKGYPYDMEKAKKILADAGYKDKDGDGFIEDKNGKPFTLNFASMSGGETAQPLAEYYMQQWAELGINVKLVDGQLMEFNSFYESLKKDDEKIDVFLGAVGIGGDPNPSGLFGRKESFNYTRWASEENDKLLAAIASDKAFEDDFRKKAFSDWQKYMMEELPVIPTLFRYGIEVVNNRVKNYDTQIGSDLSWADVELTADKPYAQ